ncbi:MAG: carbohydrate binding domain-containing protein [Dysgonamonadaceae bacterium]|jgi:hypothetical protein|nr:carbohydrate binding domain-containing protein [Dysgonamonadaceae bacterium]
MRKMVFTLLAIAWTVAVMADNIPFVYPVENTGSNCTQPPLPSVNDLPSTVRLPNPFAWSDGHGVVGSFEEWKCRRAEIKAEIEHYEIGVKPARPATLSASYSNGTLTVIVTENGQTVTLTSSVNMPAGTGPFPVIIGMNSATGSLPSSLFQDCIQIPFMHDQVATYNMSGNKDLNSPFYTMYPALSSAGDYCAWSWGVSRLIDGIEIVKEELKADLNRIGVTGCSYAGKMALFAGAFDERIALTIAQESGGGGTASWRVSETLGSVEKISSTNYSWFMPALRDNFNGKVEKLPYDHHELLAMIAPRALLALGNDGWTWMADESGYVACMAAREVWKFMGVEDRFGFDFTGGHNHCSAAESQITAVTRFVDKFLRGNTGVDTNILTSPYQNVNYQFWISDWANVTEPNVALEQTWTEAESVDCITAGSNLTTQNDADASGGKYVTVKENLNSPDVAPSAQGLLTLPFTVNNNRTFQLYLRLNTSSESALWIQIDGGTFTSYSVNTNGQWQWVPILSTPLLTGPHKLNIGFRTNGVKLDRIHITNDLQATPTGTGSTETGCVAIPKCFIFDFEAGNITGWTKQNPGREINITQEDKHWGEYALKMANGTGTSAWSVQAFTPPVDVISGHVYTVSFWIKAVDGGGKGRISTTGSGQLGNQYWNDFTVEDAWHQITYPNLTANGNTVQLAFDMGYIANKTYYIDDIVFEDITADPQPELNVQPKQWETQAVKDGISQSGKFSIRNTGSGTLVVTEITVLSAPWSTTLHTGSLNAGQAQEFTFSYSPATVGTSTLDFNIHTNAGNAVIALSGSTSGTDGIVIIENPDIKIFSPAPGKIHIAAPEDSTLQISDITGRIVRTEHCSAYPAEFPLPSGVYIVNIENNSKFYTYKIVVK